MSEERDKTPERQRKVWPEKSLEKAACALVRNHGGRPYKFTSPGMVSVPDRVLLLPGTTPFFVEFKRWGEVPTAKQFMENFAILKMGHRAYFIDNLGDFNTILQGIPYNFPRPSEVSPPGHAYMAFWQQCRDKGIDV